MGKTVIGRLIIIYYCATLCIFAVSAVGNCVISFCRVTHYRKDKRCHKKTNMIVRMTTFQSWTACQARRLDIVSGIVFMLLKLLITHVILFHVLLPCSGTIKMFHVVFDIDVYGYV